MDTLYFDEAFDGGAWPGPFHATATAGEWWVGLAGLVGQLEGQVGLSGVRPSRAERLGEAMRALGQTAGFWSASFAADPLATAETLLQLADLLALHGWSGPVDSPRLDALHQVFREVPGGLAERLVALVPAVRSRADLRWHVRLQRDGQPRRVRELLEACAGALEVAARPPALDVAALAPRLQLVRPFGPAAAAEAVAQALAASREVPTLVLGSDPVLDLALRRHGLPTTGAASEPQDNALAELLPLVVELGLDPIDPRRAVEFLTLPRRPIRGDAARRLVRALQKWPAVGSPAWLEAIAEVSKDWAPEAQQTLAQRLDTYFKATVTVGAPYPAAELQRRATALQQWLQGCIQKEESDAALVRLEAASAQVANFQALVRLTGATALPLPHVRRLLEQAQAEMPAPASWPAQAGLVGLGDAGGVVGPVERVVWWGFTREAFSPPRRLPLTRDELATLARAGVVLPSPSEEAVRRMELARRPLRFVTGEAWLVCPRHQLDGEEATAHPLWDEVAGVLGEDARRLTHDAPQVPSPLPAKPRKRLAALGPRAAWQASLPLERRKKESPSSVEGFLGCSLKWALEYQAGLKAGTSAALDTEQRMLGSLAHHVLLERVLREDHATPAAAGDFAIACFASEGRTLAAPLFLPGADAERLAVEDALRKSAVALWELVERGWRVDETEQEHVGKAFGTTFGGVIDLVLKKGQRRAVVDLKWSGARYRRELLVGGTALQLAAYVELLTQAGFKEAAVAYFIIQSQALLSAERSLVDGGALDAEVGPAQTWAALEAAHKAAWKKAKAGALEAPGVTLPAPETGLDEDGLTVSPPCGFCDFSGICGRRYGTLEGVGHDEAA
jgi:hypothetical protein